ncbi:MAG TPA: hypothetical protein VHK47_16005, partial [Polyangia bacterium]|nr:hypothetical protein [Polyangia bacterium]
MVADDREELRALVGQLRTNLEKRKRSGLMGVPRTVSARKAEPAAKAEPAPPAVSAPPARAAAAASEP